MSGLQKGEWLCCDLPITQHRDVWAIQKGLVAASKEGLIETEVILITEHYPVFTLGRKKAPDNLIASEEFLTQQGIEVIRIKRGGDITFHGPGQLIIYPIIDLRAFRLRVSEYVEMIEEVMLRTADGFGIKAGRNPLNRGIWVGTPKLGSVGIAIRRGIAFHGLALNVNTAMNAFSWINPCGLTGMEMTSMQRELSKDIPMAEVREAARQHFQSVFAMTCTMIDVNGLKERLKGVLV